MDFGVYPQNYLFSVFCYLVCEFYSHEIIEKHPLMGMKLSNLHQRNHLNQLKCCPVLIKLILNCFGVEGFSQQKNDILPQR